MGDVVFMRVDHPSMDVHVLAEMANAQWLESTWS